MEHKALIQENINIELDNNQIENIFNGLKSMNNKYWEVNKLLKEYIKNGNESL